jgi:ferric-dicitrate binding protein FerR (iron transport regulator)
MAPRLQKASEFFVASLSRPGVELADAIEVWLGKSPCHQCAWRQVRAAWDGLAQIRA